MDSLNIVCPNCGTSCNATAKFCSACGKPLYENAASAAQPKKTVKPKWKKAAAIVFVILAVTLLIVAILCGIYDISGDANILSVNTTAVSGSEKTTAAVDPEEKNDETVVYDCYYCNGNGKVGCRECGAVGTYEDDGYTVLCPVCDGTGLVDCYVCDGSGILETDSMELFGDYEGVDADVGTYVYEPVTKICIACGGIGHCTFCNAGDCRYCNGRGSEICSDCFGKGKCGRCHGDGYTYIGATTYNFKKMTCTHCHGSGVCPRCHGTKGSICAHCSGTGNCSQCGGIYICPNCGGSKYTY